MAFYVPLFCIENIHYRPNYSSPSQRPSFEHAGLTGLTLLHLELKN